MKNFTHCMLSSLLVITLSACGSHAESNAKTELHKENMKIAYLVGHLGDKSYCDSGERGASQLRQEGYQVTTYEIGDDPSRYTDLILDAIEQGDNLILGISNFLEPMDDLSKDYPDVKFVLIDVYREPEELLANQAAIYYAENESSYLIGELSAALTKTGTVAIDVGLDVPVVQDFVTGYVNGVKDWNAANGTNVKIVKGSVGSWNDPATMKMIVLDQERNSHADLFYQVAGTSGDGLFEACRETNTWAIGVDSDQYQAFIDSKNPEKAEVILTSMIKEVGKSLVSTVHAIDQGEDIWKKTEILGLAENAVGYVNNEHFRKNVPAEIRDALEKSAEDIIAKRIAVRSYYEFKDESEYEAYLDSAR